MCLIFRKIAIYLIRMNIIRFWKKAIFLIIYLAVTTAGFSQDAKEGEAEETKPVLAIIPVFSRDVPVYIPKVVDKLLDAKIEKIGTYSIMDRDLLQGFLDDNGIVLKRLPGIDDLKKYSDKIGADQILLGRVGPEGEGYSLETKVFDVEKGEIILSDTETAPNLRGLDQAVDSLTRRIVQQIFPPEVVTEVEKVLDEEKDTKKEAQVKESIESFAELVEKDPDKALEMFDEPARKALEDKVKEKVVHEEIQNLFEQEKEEKARAAKRKRQLWTVFGLETFNQIGNLFNSLAEYERLDSLLYWNKYMNNQFSDDPYSSYTRSVKDYGGFLSQRYILSGIGTAAKGFVIGYMLDDTLSFTPLGRKIFAVSYGLNTLGNAVSTLTTQLGYISLHYYLEYANADSDFTVKYNKYRDSLVWSEISRYTAYGFWGLGYTGMIVSSLLPGEKEGMIVSESSRSLLKWGSFITGAGVFASGIAMNYRGIAEESWITVNSPSGIIGDDLTKNYTLIADIATYTSYALAAAGSAMSVIGLLIPPDRSTGESPVKKNEENLSFNFVQSPEGPSLIVNLRLE